MRGVSAGLAHSAAVKTDGTVWAWGANDHHQLGNNSTVPQSAPVQVRRDTVGNPLTGISPTIALGGNHALVVGNDLTMYGFGEQFQGPDKLIGTVIGFQVGLGVAVVALAGIAWMAGRNRNCWNQQRTPDPVYVPRDSLGRPLGASRALNAASLRIGKRVDVLFEPIGRNSVQLDRGHLMGNQFGGSSSNRDNIVAMTPQANQGDMARTENAIASHLLNTCQQINYAVTANYLGSNCQAPAFGTDGKPTAGTGPDCYPASVTLVTTGGTLPVNQTIPNI